uniref:Acid phosphatase 1 n=1 Tax=Solanum tuberosum TaxID=4113 RepID=M1DPV0_SOLTU
MALPSNVGYPVPQLDCLSWRLAVETNNLQNWKTMGGNDSKSAVEYKSSKRMEWVKDGYRIGNIGDQWTDLIGENVGARTFKVPNPMYYVG